MLLDDKYAKSILHVLHENGPMTRKQIMDQLKMRLNSLVDICNQLMEAKHVIRTDSKHQRNVPLILNQKRFASIGVEHAKDHIRCVLMDVTGKKVCSADFPIDAGLGGKDRLEKIMEIIRAFKSLQRGISVASIGFADIGIVNTESGTGVYSVHVPDWENIPMAKLLEREFGLFCRIVDRSGASALDQLRTNPDNPSVRTSLQIYIGNGIGASILQNGRYWGADTPSSCQLGHTIAVPDGEICHCGNRGCLETIATVPAVLKKITEMSHGRIQTQETFFRKAADGDRLCELVLREAGTAMGIAVANVVTFTAITSVMIRSVLCKASPVYFEAFREAVLKNTIYPCSKSVKVQINQQDEDCAATGAAFYAQNEYFSIDRRST